MGKTALVQREAIDTDTEAALLPLDAPRAVAFKTKTGNFVYHFRRIEQKDWEHFFSSIVHQTVQSKGSREQVFESETALVELVDNTVASVDGYGTIEPKNWKRTLPVAHKLAAGIALRSVGTSNADAASATLCDLVEVNLEANWGVGDGKTVYYSGLIHRFRQPGIAELRRYNFERARVKVTGTAENGVTSFPASQVIAMKIYDDLIDSVEGYSVMGMAIQPEQIKGWMDGAHKAAACLALFTQDDSITLE